MQTSVKKIKKRDWRVVKFDQGKVINAIFKAAEAIGATAGQDQIGIVAQELEAILPELVSTPEDGYKSVDYTKLTAVLVEAIKELKLQNQELERRIDVLERTVQCQQCNRWKAA